MPEEYTHEIIMSPKWLAREFHNTYENFAVNNGWKTQTSCKVAFDNLPEKNKETMIDTCRHIILWLECFIRPKDSYNTGDKKNE